MEFYQNGGTATARLLWSDASITEGGRAREPVVSVGRPGQVIRINFQLAAAPVPAGYLADGGPVFGARGNGQTYGWNADNTAQATDRNRRVARSGVRHVDPPAEAGEPERVLGDRAAEWRLRRAVVTGDASNYDSVFRIAAEGVLVVNGAPTTSRWIEGTATVTVADGRLTLTSAAGRATTRSVLWR